SSPFQISVHAPSTGDSFHLYPPSFHFSEASISRDRKRIMVSRLTIVHSVRPSRQDIAGSIPAVVMKFEHCQMPFAFSCIHSFSLACVMMVMGDARRKKYAECMAKWYRV